MLEFGSMVLFLRERERVGDGKHEISGLGRRGESRRIERDGRIALLDAVKVVKERVIALLTEDLDPNSGYQARKWPDESTPSPKVPRRQIQP